MKISSLSMVNFRSHSATTVSAPSGLVAIVGSNGAGKSNVIRALEFLVTGAVHGASKEDLLRWGASSGHVSGTIETDDAKVEIYRSVSSSTARLYVDGKEFAVGIRDVNAEMLRRFGVDKDVAKFVFTGQGEIDGLLFDPPAQRETSVLKLCGLSDATVVHKALGECMPLLVGGQNNHELHGQLVALLAETDTHVAALRASVASNAPRPSDTLCDSNAKLRVHACAISAEMLTLRARVNEAEEAKAVTAKVLSMTPSAGGDKAELLTRLSQAEKEGRHRGSVEALNAARDTRQKALDAVKLGEAEITTAANGMDPEAYRASAEALMAQSTAAIQQHNACDAYGAQLSMARAKLAEAIRTETRPQERAVLCAPDGEPLPFGAALSAAILDVVQSLALEAENLHKAANDAKTQLEVMRSGSITARQALLTGLTHAASVECPTCTSQVSREIAPRIQARIADAGPEEAALLRAYDIARSRTADHAAYTGTLTTKLRSIESVAANLGPAPTRPEVTRSEALETAAALSARLSQLRQLVLGMQMAKHAAASAEANFKAAEARSLENPAVAELSGAPDDVIRKLLQDLPAQIGALDKSAAAVAAARRNDDLAAATLEAVTTALKRRTAETASELPNDLWHMATDRQNSAFATWVSDQLRQEEELDRRRKALIGFEAQLAGAEAQRKTLSAKIEAVSAQMAQDAPRQKLVEDVTKIRDWFHYSNGPKRVAVGIMSRMTHGVNELLQYMQAPFSVTLHGLEYRVHFLDGRTDALPDGAEASQLSGGQRVLLSIAVHFARYRMFASKLGILVLDEPTVYLDPVSVASVCDALDKVRQLAHKLGMQIWLCTHEPVLLPVCDHVITITGNA